MTQRGEDGLWPYQREFLNALDDQAIIKQIIDGTYVSQVGKSLVFDIEAGSYDGRRGPKPPGIEVFTHARELLDQADMSAMKIAASSPYGHMYDPQLAAKITADAQRITRELDLQIYNAVTVEPPPKRTNRHERRRAAKLRGK